MKICILGAGGCFGNSCAQYFIALGCDVFGIGRSQRKSAAFTQGADYPYHTFSIGVDNEFIMDLLDAQKPSLIINFAAQGEGAASFTRKHQKYFYLTNTVALVELVEHLSQRPWLERFIQIGTSELYGSVQRASLESDQIIPTSPYAVSKAAFDLHLQAIARVQEFQMNIIRPSNCYVPGQQLHRIIPKTLVYGMSGRKIPLHGGGLAEKSYLHATDLNSAIHAVIEHGTVGEIYNVGPLQPTSIREVVERCAAVLDKPFEEICELAPDREGQDSRYWLDSAKIRNIGWSPVVAWEEGLEEMKGWIGKYPELLGMPTEFRMRA